MRELKPCPFCGFEIISSISSCNSAKYLCALCDESMAIGDTEENAVWEKAAIKWNTRAVDPRISELEAENVDCESNESIAYEQLDAAMLEIKELKDQMASTATITRRRMILQAILTS